MGGLLGATSRETAIIATLLSMPLGGGPKLIIISVSPPPLEADGKVEP